MQPSRVTKEELSYLDDFVSKVNAYVIEKSGGTNGAVNIGNLSFGLWRSLKKAKKEIHKDNFHKVWASQTLCEIAQLHPFTDGNKRTSYVISKLILYLGGLDFDVKYEKAQEYLIKIACKKIPHKEVYLWIDKHSKDLEEEISSEVKEFVAMLAKAVE